MEKVVNLDKLSKGDKITVRVKKYKMTLKEQEKALEKAEQFKLSTAYYDGEIEL
jgi:uncharacterized membrane protein YjjP (DUF1212 family)|tara:strand:+ start:193 stop:354 length:162 start_codon:yes stop_codon:yes gene_type:complete